MSQVLLRDCIEDLRGCLGAGRYSDALALGRHILQYFPKHLETYRLLGETYLELNELEAAADLFNRVRSADPESVAALIGLAVVHERRGQAEEALWHLQRAFEIQPSNPDLRRELVRLAPEGEQAAAARVKLPPSGLARLYARQGFNAQAIREFRALLRSDPSRLDLQVALIQVLFREGQLQEAARGAQAILETLPYCLKANLILGKLWTENGVTEGEELIKRARALDPEQVLARDLQIDLGEFTPPTLPAPEGMEIASAAPPEEVTANGEFESAAEIESLEALFGPAAGAAGQVETEGEKAATEQAAEAVAPSEEGVEAAIPWLQELELPESENVPEAGEEIPAWLAAVADAPVEETDKPAEKAGEQPRAVAQQPQADATEAAVPESLTKEQAPPLSAQMPFEEGLAEAAVQPEGLTAEPVPTPLASEPPRSHPAEPPAAVPPAALAEEKPAAVTSPEAAPAVPTFLRIEGAEPTPAEPAPAEIPAALQQEGPHAIEEAAASAIAPFAQPTAAPLEEAPVEPEGGLSLLWTVEELFAKGADQAAAGEQGEAAEQAPAAAASTEEPETAEPTPAAEQEQVPPATLESATEPGVETAAPETQAQEPPAPGRRAPAVPTVAPTIPGALNKLPVWLLRFITRRPTDVIPLPPPAPAVPGNGSAGLEEQEVNEDEDEVLPGWLAAIQAGQGQPAAGPGSVVKFAQQNAEAEADREDLPSWLRDERARAAASGQVAAYALPVTGEPAAPAAAWLDAAGYAAGSVAPPDKPSPPAQTEWNAGVQVGVSSAAAAPVPPQLTDEEQAELPDWLRSPSSAPAQSTSARSMPQPTGQAPNPLATADPAALLEQARRRAAEGKHAEALDLYEKIIHLGPRQLQPAIADLEALAAQPGAPSSAHRVLGDAYAMTGRFKDAIEQYRQVLNK